MSVKITISIADKVFEEIEKRDAVNRSEYIEELIRVGLAQLNEKKHKKEVEADATTISAVRL
jgi:metal-responsive CopG/Arc/MetJ family transcriptional regulator